MGGHTKVMLNSTSRDNIARHNARLEIHRVPKKYRFYGPDDVVVEYEYFRAEKGTYPEHMFPKASINSFADFKRHWNTDACGECFVPPFGALTFDCYFGRMSKGAMRAVAKYLIANVSEIASVRGSFVTFMERGMTATERKIWKEMARPAAKQAA
jgi:hypothetical protein